MGMGDGGIYVVLRDPLANYIETRAVSDLRVAVNNKGRFYEEVGGRNKDTFWRFEDGLLTTENDDYSISSIMYPRHFDMSFFDMKNNMMLVREHVHTDSYNPKVPAFKEDRYFLFKDGSLVSDSEEIKKAIKNEFDISIPGLKMKNLDTLYISKGVAEFIAEPESIKE
jgi:hypothetical protein